MIKCVKVRALFAKNKVRFARVEQVCFCSKQPADTLSGVRIWHKLLNSNAQFGFTYLCRHRPMDARKHRCRILLAASEPVTYRLVLNISILMLLSICFAKPVDTVKHTDD